MRFLTRFGRLFPRNQSVEDVATKVRFHAAAETVWQAMLFYEEVPGPPTPLLRLFLPTPIRTQGEKTRVGAIIECKYDGGYLEKRITAAERARFVRFDVLVQQLGVEDCISMTGGSYELSDHPGGSELVLTTRYRGHMRPRWLWRPLECFLAHRLHRHILDGMRAALGTSAPVREAPPVGARS